MGFLGRTEIEVLSVRAGSETFGAGLEALEAVIALGW